MDLVDTPKKEIQDINITELIEKIIETIKIAAQIAALNPRGTNRERTNKCAQEMKNIRLLADKDRPQDAVNNIGVAFRVMEMLTETSDEKIVNKNVKDIATEILDNDDESLTSVSEYDSANSYFSDSD